MTSNVTRLYQAVLRDPTPPISIRLRRGFSDWVVRKGFPPPSAAVVKDEAEAGGARLVMERRGDCGRYTLDEPYEQGRLRTRVTYAESVPAMTGWVVVTVEQHGGPDPAARRGAKQRGRQRAERQPEPAMVKAPGFLRAYLNTARISDGAVQVEGAAVLLTEDGVQRFVSVMTEPRRRVPILVVSPDPRDPEVARERADQLADGVAGAGLVVRLADLRAQDRFNEAMGPELGVFGAAVRTYFAPFDPAGEQYPRRHPPMGDAAIRSRGAAALDRIVDGAIGETAHRKLPDDMRRTLDVVYRVLAGRAEPGEIADAAAPRPSKVDFAREEMRRRMMAMTRRPTAPKAEAVTPAKAAVQATVEITAEITAETTVETAAEATAETARSVADMVVKELRGELEAALGLATSSQVPGDSGQVLREIRVLGAHLSGLRDIAAERRGDGPATEAERNLRDEHRLLNEEYAEAVTSARKLAERVRWLERRLAEAGQPVYGVTEDDPVFEPGGLVEVLAEARESLRHIGVGDTYGAAARLDLEHHIQCRTWAAKAWDALRALDDFAGARSGGRFAGGFYDWCAGDSPGRRTIPTGMLSMRESKSVVTRAKFSAPRRFAVPPEVHPSGRILMESHIKLRPVGYPAPRMYFHDDSAGSTGRIWIGYLGDHLPNTRTN
ncbi:hypothetical protein ACFQVD_41420 [Streptosporangium amethystogenes subsp. fukuiense]|uniref:Uncharacterized protein n=1 Tax=Streptosporangium amethystogenes subsp. fukuiense TaxID=698418 RepID=A0ABW2TGC6_9ACTN